MTQDIQYIDRIIKDLLCEVNKLRKKNAELKRCLAVYAIPKNNRNSLIPFSKDVNRPKRRSLREKTARKPGVQHGMKGNTLRMVPSPDTLNTHTPVYCTCRGKDILEVLAKFAGKRQVIDIHEIK